MEAGRYAVPRLHLSSVYLPRTIDPQSMRDPAVLRGAVDPQIDLLLEGNKRVNQMQIIGLLEYRFN